GHEQANGGGLEADADAAVRTQAQGDIRSGEGHQRRDADEQRRGLAEVGRVEQAVDEAADAEGDRNGGDGARRPPGNRSRVDSQLHPMCPSFRKSLNHMIDLAGRLYQGHVELSALRTAVYSW